MVINQDYECEHPVPEDVFANLAYVSGIQNIVIVRIESSMMILMNLRVVSQEYVCILVQ